MLVSNAFKLSVFLLVFGYSKCYNILAVFNIPSKSIHLAAMSMMRILTEKGHNVTVVTAYKSDEKYTNLTHVFLEDTAEYNESE